MTDERTQAIVDALASAEVIDDGSSAPGDRKARSRPKKQWAMFPSELQGKPVPDRQWCVPGWIPDRYVTLLTGDGGTGKSLLAMQLATCAAVGLPFLGIELAPRRVLYLSCEDDVEEMHRRQVNINNMLGIDFKDLMDMLIWKSPTGDDAVLFGPDPSGKRLVSTALYHNLAEYCVESYVQLIVVDTLADTFAGLEIDRQQVTRFVRALQSIAAKTDGAVLLLGHPSVAGMRDGAGISGSTAWRNAVRSVIHLRRPTSHEAVGAAVRDMRILESLKGNYAPAGAELRLRWVEGAFLSDGPHTDATTPIDQIAIEVHVSRALAEMLKNGIKPSPSSKAEEWAAKLLLKSGRFANLKLMQLDAIVSRMVQNGSLRVALVGIGKNQRKVVCPSDTPPLYDERDPLSGERKTRGAPGSDL